MSESIATVRTSTDHGRATGEMPRDPVRPNAWPDQQTDDDSSSRAVDRFAAWHERHESLTHGPSYRALLPAQPPATGQQYAFEVDLDRCSGCKACVTACHSLNGLDEGETWRDVGLLVGGTTDLPVLQHVTTACHHCLEPACLTACPVNAYEKHPQTGIVRHLDDQCIGCQYCTLACPYDVPKYHPRKGIVRKCDMCSERLLAGEAPACVQACPHQAIRIRTIDVRDVLADAETGVFLPAAPDPLLTFPTTTYRMQRSFPRNALPADYFDVDPQHAHWPLVVMLVLTQAAVGACLVGGYFERSLPAEVWSAVRPVHALSTAAWGLLALVASTFHLGRPQYAYRAILGLGHSWLSREIVSFALFLVFTALHAAAVITGRERASLVLAGLGGLSGTTTIICSVMIYAVTRRQLWTPLRTGIRFCLTMGLLGAVAVWLAAAVAAYIHPSSDQMSPLAAVTPTCAGMVQCVMATKLIYEAALVRHLFSRRMTSLKRSALLITRRLARTTGFRFALGALGGLMLPAWLWSSQSTGGAPVHAWQAWGVVIVAATCVAGELLERLLFFRSVASARMPGAIR